MEILRELRRLGKTIFISSHILSELAELCDSVTIIDRGQIRFSGPMDALLDNSQDHPTFNLKFADSYENALPQLRALPGVADVKEPEFVTGKDFIIELTSETSANAFLQSVLTLNLPIISFSQQRRHLNQAFMDLTTRGVRT
jgi:ABC-2 type transport system ATP-binding protein